MNLQKNVCTDWPEKWDKINDFQWLKTFQKLAQRESSRFQGILALSLWKLLLRSARNSWKGKLQQLLEKASIRTLTSAKLIFNSQYTNQLFKSKMLSDIVLFSLCLLLTFIMIFILVYFLITLSDLECDYLNATECCGKLNFVSESKTSKIIAKWIKNSISVECPKVVVAVDDCATVTDSRTLELGPSQHSRQCLPSSTVINKQF